MISMFYYLSLKITPRKSNEDKSIKKSIVQAIDFVVLIHYTLDKVHLSICEKSRK